MDVLLCLDSLQQSFPMLLLVAFSSLMPLAFKEMIPSLLSINFYRRFTMTPEAEKFNGWAAMLGIIAAFGSYATTGQLIPGIW